MDESIHHTRVNNILLGPFERPTLRWLAVHSPQWITPDIYTGIGVLGSILILIGYILSQLHPGYFWLATFGFFLNWFGDSMDGTLARYRQIERPVYGFFIDHITDAISQVFVFVGLGFSPYVRFDVAVLTLVAYLLLSVLIYVRTIVVGEFKISYGMLGPTEARVVAILLNISMFYWGSQVWGVTFHSQNDLTFSLYDIGVAVMGLILVYFFLTTAFREIARLSRAGR